MNLLRSGVDLVDIQRLADLKPAIRERFLRRVYTPHELSAFQSSFTSLAGRFAAKEAVAKALGVGIGPIGWQEIEILSGPEGEPVLQLHGAAQVLADQLGLDEWSISISHTHTQAIAMVVALARTALSGAGEENDRTA
jgi:holo-[acyl-carrier protein] synthase